MPEQQLSSRSNVQRPRSYMQHGRSDGCDSSTKNVVCRLAGHLDSACVHEGINKSSQLRLMIRNVLV